MKNNNVSITSDAREMAVNLVYNIMENGTYANLGLENSLRGSTLSQTDKNLVTELVNGSIRMIKHLDWVLNLFLHKSIHDQNPLMRSVLRIAVYQIMFMERIPDYAAVNSAVDITRKKINKTLAGVCNAVLRSLIRNKNNLSYPPANSLAYLSVYYSQPEWLVQLWLDCYGNEMTRNMLAYMNRKPPLVLRANALRVDAEKLAQELTREGVASRPSNLIPDSLVIEAMETSIDQLNSYKSGLFYIQNEASMVAANILDPREGEHILDLCSGVGGKATHFAEKMKNQGVIKAVELYKHKLSILNSNCQRLGINIIDAEKNDILAMKSDPVWQRVFLDVPCSGLGVLNRRADARWHKNPREIKELIKLQQALLEKAGEMTAPGGILVYSTCTINPYENDKVILSYLEENPEFHLESLADLISYFPLEQKDREIAKKGWLTIIPGKYGCDGMFYARLRRSN